MTYNLWSDLSKDLSSLIDNDDDYNDYNVIIKVGEKEFRAHSNILRCRSNYFRHAISKNWWSMNENKKFVLSKPNMKPEVFDAVLNGSFNFNEFSPQIILEILEASDEFILESLIDTIQTYMIEKQSEWLQLNIINPLNIVCKHDHITKLRNHLTELVCKKPHLLFASMDFPLLEESALIYVLKQDDLELEEMKILENVINWGAANSNPKLSQDRTKWTNNDLLELKRTLHHCIPFIRFFHIHYNDVMRTPFQDILSKKVKNNVRNYHLNPYTTERLQAG
ncbi:17775_t:CDS:2 [Funneliformis geosporum]|uniref:17775_t:CDS:1 n=1 Tax=Funneliformis geosporum TaxID=1117311 RepID=A0A9W4SMC7_9GLOM|nr:17775_t:CDS:2 [Funneliformis geosporum]